MKTMPFFITALVAFCLLGCASTKLDDHRLSQIVPGKTTKSDLIQLLGKPNSQTTSPEGNEILTWRSSERLMPPEHAILHDPVVPKGDPGVRTRTVQVVLDASGKVLKYDTARNDGTSRVIIQSD